MLPENHVDQTPGGKIGRRQNKCVRTDLLKFDPSLFSQWVVSRYYKCRCISDQRLIDHVVWYIGHRTHGDIRFIGAQSGEAISSAGDILQFYLNFGIFPGEIPQRFGQQIENSRLTGSNVQFSRFQQSQLSRERLVQFIHTLDQRHCQFQQPLAFRCQANPGTPTFKQGGFQLPFKRLYLQRDCWLAEKNKLCSFADAAGFCRMTECTQLFQSVLLVINRRG